MIRFWLATLLSMIAAMAYGANDGDADAAFGYQGASYLNWNFFGSTQTVSKVLPMPDGRVVLVGNVSTLSFMDDGNDIGVARLLPNGFFDTTFGDSSTPGQMLITPGSGMFTANDAALDASGGIFIAGQAVSSGFVSSGSAVLWHVTAAGALDTSFGSSGSVGIARNSGINNDAFNALLIGNGNNLPTYQIVLGATIQNAAEDSAYAIFVISTDGVIQRGFGNSSLPGGGSYWTETIACAGGSGSSNDAITSLAFNPNYPANSTTYVYASGTCSDTGNTEATVLAFNGSTVLDSNFGAGGLSHFHFLDGTTGVSTTTKIAAARDGSGALFIAGNANQDDGTTQMAIAKVAASGSFDTDFGFGGEQVFNVASDCCSLTASSYGNALLVQADNNVLLGGQRGSSSQILFSVLRVNGNDGSLDASWGNDGELPGARTYSVPVSQTTGNNGLNSMAFTAGPENLLIAGFTVDPNSTTTASDYAVMRIHNDAIFADGFE